MRCAAVLLVVAGLSGCGRASPEPADDGPIPDFSRWPAATDHPVPVEAAQWLFCAPPPPGKLEADRKTHGPHYRPSIVVRTNPEAFEAFRARRPLPVGAVVVKEKHPDMEAKDPPAEYTAMVKREPGYDPDHGDWEYLHVVLRPERQVTRGRLESCIECHATVRATDYLFRSYLPPAE